MYCPCGVYNHRGVEKLVTLVRYGFDSLSRIFLGLVTQETLKLVLQWLPCQAPGIIGSALGLVGLVSVFCDWVREKVSTFYLSVVARALVRADPSLRCTNMLLGL